MERHRYLRQVVILVAALIRLPDPKSIPVLIVLTLKEITPRMMRLSD